MFRKLLFGSIYRGRRSALRLNSNDVCDGHEITLNAYQEASDNTLEELCEKLESILEDHYDKGADVSLNNGVLTCTVNEQNIYVINKQTPNRQIWFSSPISGPKKFDYVSGSWVERHSKTELKSLLSEELSKLLSNRVDW